MRSSGAKGLPFLMPIEAHKPTSSGLNASAGSHWTTALSSS